MLVQYGFIRTLSHTLFVLLGRSPSAIILSSSDEVELPHMAADLGHDVAHVCRVYGTTMTLSL